MAARGKKARATTSVSPETAKLEETVRRVVDELTRSHELVGFRGPSLFVRERREPVVSTVDADHYLQIVDSEDKIVEISTAKIKERLSKVMESIADVAQQAENAAKNITSNVGKPPFELDEIKIGLSINVKAGVIFWGAGGDVDLELKFVRSRGDGTGKTA